MLLKTGIVSLVALVAAAGLVHATPISPGAELTVIDLETGQQSQFLQAGSADYITSGTAASTLGNFSYSASEYAALGYVAGSASYQPISFSFKAQLADGIASLQSSDTLEFIFSANGFGAPAGSQNNGIAMLDSSGGVLTDGTVTMTAHLLGDNTDSLYSSVPVMEASVYGVNATTGSAQNLTTTPISFNLPAALPADMPTPNSLYSLTEVVQATFPAGQSNTITLTGSGETVISAAAVTTPEPAPLALMVTGILVLSLLVRRRSAADAQRQMQ
ncbi:MAG: PEP-CTERM sorting domain-containing protein [Phycisphaerae bacterium]